jgi:hypothetical protein
LAALTLAGCAGDGDSVAPVKREQPLPQSARAKTALKDPHSAASTLSEFWRYLAAGALPAVFTFYNEDVIRALGPAMFGGTMASEQGTALTTRLNIYDVKRIAGGTLVLVETIPEAAPKSRHSFFLEAERRGGWHITYDTLTAAALMAYAQQQEQQRIDPSAKVPSRRAIEAGEKALMLFRRVALAPD